MTSVKKRLNRTHKRTERGQHPCLIFQLRPMPDPLSQPIDDRIRNQFFIAFRHVLPGVGVGGAANVAQGLFAKTLLIQEVLLPPLTQEPPSFGVIGVAPEQFGEQGTSRGQLPQFTVPNCPLNLQIWVEEIRAG